MGGIGSGRKKNSQYKSNSLPTWSSNKTFKVGNVKKIKTNSKELKGLYSNFKNYKGGG